MLRLETNDLSRAKEIMLHPELVRESGLDAAAPVWVTGPDRTIILIMDDDVPVGYIGFVHPQPDRAEMGVAVLSEYRGSEIKTAVKAAITAMFHFNFKIITCKVRKSNIPSVAGAQILGFRKTREDSTSIYFAMTREAWFQRNPSGRQ